jgi:CBS domain-containing protein
MSIVNLCRCEAITVTEDRNLTAAAQLMRESHIGYLVVVRNLQSDRRPKVVGVLTDRDIVMTAVARGIDPKFLTVGEVMTRDPLLATEHYSLDATLRLMRDCGVRRVPVVDHEGMPVGVLSIDDIVKALAGQMSCLAAMIDNEQQNERLMRVPAATEAERKGERHEAAH